MRIERLFAGPARPLGGAATSVVSGIVKHAHAGPLALSRNGLEGDEQGDRMYHGGPEKALHQYASEHYGYWRTRFPDSLAPLEPGVFGENISTTGMSERNVHIGDIYRVGTALVQVSQGRQPCWKLNRRLGHQQAALAMQGSGATGWYYRVLEEGSIAQGDCLTLEARPCPVWPMARLIAALFPTDVALPGLREEWRLAAQIDQLSPNWRVAFARRVETGRVEDWTRRLYE